MFCNSWRASEMFAYDQELLVLKNLITPTVLPELSALKVIWKSRI